MLCYNTLEFYYWKELGNLKPNGGSNEWFKGAFILTIGALLTKILSAGYRVPFQNIVGDIGFYIYQQVYPFYGLALVLSTYGFPVIISKHFTELKEKNQMVRAYRFLALSYLVLTIFGIMAFLSLYYGSSFLAKQMNDTKLELLLKVISVVFLVFPTIAVLRGYFQGLGNMVPTATSQVGEQLLRVTTILSIAILFTKEGFSLYMVGGGAAFGSITGGIMAIVILIFFFIKDQKDKNDRLKIWSKDLLSDLGKVSKLLFLQGFAVCLSGMVFIFMQLADALNMISLLVSMGLELESAKALKGVYDRGQPLIQLGTIVATSMSLSLVPIISSVRIKENRSELYEKIRFAINISLIIGAAATIGLLAIIQPTNIMLYENEAGSSILAALTPIILLSSLLLTLIAILQGLGVMFYPAIVIFISFILKYLLNITLISGLGPMGAAIATNISIGFGVLLLWWKLSHLINKSLFSLNFIWKLGGIGLLMYLFLKSYLFMTQPTYQMIESKRLVASFQSLSAVSLGGILFLIVIMRSRLLRFEDLALLPFGSKLVFLLPKQRRMNQHGKKN